MIGKPQLYISIDGQPEFNITDKIPKLEFLGLDSTPDVTNSYQDNSGLDGSMFNLASFNKNIVNMNFFIHYHDYYEYKAIKHQIYQLFMQKRIYRVRTDAEPNFVYFLRPATSEIRLIEDGVNDSQFTLPFENPSGYKFSRYDSMNQLDLWDDFPLGWDIPAMDREDFHFKNKSFFKLLNPSGIPIDPYEENHKLKITMTWIGPKITLTNLENGSTYSYFEENDGTTEIVLDGIETFKRSQQVNANTDFGNIKLEPRFNRFRVDGTNQFEIKFDFPFLYV